jgi:hypothetical protein
MFDSVVTKNDFDRIDSGRFWLVQKKKIDSEQNWF